MNFDEHCRFPVAILYDDGDMGADETPHMLTNCRRIDIKAGPRGRFADATIVDSAGFAWRMSGVEEVDRPTGLQRLALCFGQNMRVRPRITGAPQPIDLQLFKEAVVQRLKKRDAVTIALKLPGGQCGCATLEKRIALGLIPKVQPAASIADVIGVVLSADFPERQQWLPS